MSISVRTADVIVRVAGEDVTLPEDAVIDAEPALTPVSSPAALMVAKLVALEFHVTLFVMSVVLPSENMPLAVNDCVWPAAIEAVAGATTIDVSCSADTVAVADAVADPIVAVIVEFPAETPVTRPDELTVAEAPIAVQVARLVTSCDVPSLYTPSADSCLLCPDAMENPAGVIVIDESPADEPVTFEVPETEFIEAVIVTVPAFNEVSIPEALTVATVASELCQLTRLVTVCVLLSE